MKIICPGCKKTFEMEHIERGRKVQCQCSCKFLLDDASVVEDYSSIDEPPPVRIGPCEIERFIGRGGMGRVYKGRHPALGIPVAVKTLLKDYATDRSFKVRFIQSAKICAQVAHPNIVRIYDCGEEDGCVYLVLEYIGGGSVQQMIERHGPLSFERTCDIAIAVCKGLSEAARHGIVHRDIKPENIMRSRDGEYKLSDLGLAKQRSEDQRKFDPSLTMAFVSLGTPQYMPPEQAIDAKSCDVRADIYSLGVSLYEIATGRLPFESKETIELCRQHAMEEPPPPSSLRPDINPALERIILKCMRKDRKDRYQSPEELLGEFEALKEGRPLPSELAEAERVANAIARKRSFIRGVVLLAVALLMALVSIHLWLREKASKAEVKTSVETGKAPSGGKAESPKADAGAEPQGAEDKVSKRRQELWSYASSMADKSLQTGDLFDLAIANLRAFTEDEDSKEFAAAAAKRIEALSSARNIAVAKVMASLAEEAKPLVEAGELARAASLYETYSGRLAKDTAAARQPIAAAYREAARKIDDARKAEAEAVASKLKKLLSEVAVKIASLDIQGARAVASSQDAIALCPELKDSFDAIENAPSMIADSFNSQTGMQLYLSIAGSKAFITVKRVEDGAVYADEAINRATLQRRFTASDLTLQERLGRLQGMTPSAKALYEGIENLRLGFQKEALLCFKRAGRIASALCPLLERDIAEKAEAAAKAELLAILSSCSFNVRELPAPDEFPTLAAWVGLGPEDAAKTAKRLGEFLLDFRDTLCRKAYVQAVESVIKELGQSAVEQTRTQPVRKPPYKIKTAKDLDRELILFNPAYLGGAAISIAEGGGFTLELSGQPIDNLEPLRGITVRTLIANNTPVSDLRPLMGAPIENLQIANTKVTDIKPIERMRLKCLAFNPDALSDKDGVSIVRRMKSLEYIGAPSQGAIEFLPAKRFWELFDSRRQAEH